MSKNPRHLPFGKAADAAKVIVFVAMEGWSLKGGQGDYVRELAQALGTQGHQVFVVNPYYARPHADIASDPGQWLDVSVHRGALHDISYPPSLGF